MNLEIHHKTPFDFKYQRLLKDLLLTPSTSSPRGMEIKERIGFSYACKMSPPVITNAVRKIHLPFLFGEAAWILSGKDDVKSIEPFNRHISRFSDDGDVFFGAYGPKISNQIEYVIEKLLSDTHSRQAVINIWRENPPLTKDVPCTLSFQFLIRGGQLHMVSTMRSNDIWLGLPYDLFNFSMLGWFVALALRERDPSINVEPGTVHHNVGSLHLYQSNVNDAERAVGCDTFRKIEMPTFRSFSSALQLVESLKTLAKSKLK